METIPRLIAKYLSAMCADYLLAAVDGFYYSKCKEREDLYQLYFYRQTSIKQSPSIKRTPIKIPTSSPLIYCKFDLYEAVISIKRMQSPFRIPNWLILLYFTSIKRSRNYSQSVVSRYLDTMIRAPCPVSFNSLTVREELSRP